jgi:cell division protein FtsA
MARPKSRHSFAALDIGSSKICCFIGKADDAGRLRITGIGHVVSQGMKSGTVVHIDQLEHAIANAVHAAEQMAGETVRSVYINVSCGQPQSAHCDVDVLLHGQAVRDLDMQKLLDKSQQTYWQMAHAQHGANDNVLDRHLLHAIPVGYSLDGSRGIRDPRGMFGQQLGASVHLISTQNMALRNLTLAVEHAHLDIDGLVLSPYAAGLSCLVEDELDLGCTLLDLGGGCSSIGVFFDGNLLFSDIVPLGGQHITNDLARGLSTPLAQAERLKTLHGSALASPDFGDDRINVPQLGEDDGEANSHYVPRAQLNRIIQPRIEEILETTRDRLAKAGVDKIAGQRLVLTGGGSQLSNIRELAAQIFGKNTRLGRPIRLAGLAEATTGPAFSVAAGILTYAVQKDYELSQPKSSTGKNASWVQRMKHWIDEIL